MNRRRYIVTSGLLVCSGCVSDAEQEPPPASEFTVENTRDTEIDVSIQLKDGESAFAVEEFVLDPRGTARFTMAFHDLAVGRDMSLVVKILEPQEAAYEQEALPVGVPVYRITIQSDGVDVVWAEN